MRTGDAAEITKTNFERSIYHETKEEILVDGCMLCYGFGNLLPCFCDGYHCKYKFTHINRRRNGCSP